MYIKAPSTVSALEARRSAVLPFCATDINSQVRRYLAKQNYQAFLAQLEIVKGIARRRICVQRYRRAKAAALCLHAWARGFVARCSYKALVQRCKGGYSCAYGERRQRQQLKLKQGQQVDNDGNGDIGSNHHGGSGCSGSAVVVIAPREKPIPPRLWAPTLQVIIRKIYVSTSSFCTITLCIIPYHISYHAPVICLCVFIIFYFASLHVNTMLHSHSGECEASWSEVICPLYCELHVQNALVWWCGLELLTCYR